MPGKAYNPKIFELERNAHERFNGLPQKAVEAYREARAEERAKAGFPEKWTFEQLWDMHKAGRSGQVGHFISEMVYDIYMGIEDELIENSIDTQVRLYPDYVPRSNDIIEYAIKASKAKMRAFISQDHFFPTVGQAWAAQQRVNEMVRNGELEYACQCLGSHILAWSHHPDQIHLIHKYPNLGGILFWCQSMGGQNCGPDLRIYDENGKLDSEVKEVIRLCAQYKIPVMTCHATMAYDLILPMAQYASEVGAHLLWMHAAPWAAWGGYKSITIKQYKELASLGCYLQVDANKVLPSIIWPMIDPNKGLEWAAEVGPDHVIPCTDGGQPFFGDALDCWRMFVRAMIHFGIEKEDIKTMIQTNPAKFLYLDD
jgi:hypothetical protein